MIQPIIIGGEPGTGKSELMRKLIKSLYDAWRPTTEAEKFEFERNGGKRPYYVFDYKKLRGLVFVYHCTTILGLYNQGDITPGTDRLSMAVQPDAEEYFAAMKKRHSDSLWNVVLEGDRLCNDSFIRKLKSLELVPKLIFLETSQEERDRRLHDRGSNQKETFKRGRITKYANLKNIYPDAEVWRNENGIDQIANFSKLISLILTGVE